MKKKPTPTQLGWKYLAINMSKEDHKEYTEKLDVLVKTTGMNKKKLIVFMIDNLYTKIIGGNYENCVDDDGDFDFNKLCKQTYH